MTVVIVGASVAGIRVAQSLRMHDFAGPVIIIGAELHHPYDKPPISKGMLAPDGEPVPLLSAADLERLDVDLRLGVEATSLDTKAQVVTTAAGEQVPYDILVIATGVNPRVLPGTEGLRGVHTLRNADDAAAVRAQIPHAANVVGVGAGFIGSEFACSARKYGVNVELVEPQETPLAHILGPDVGAELARLHALNGVNVNTGVSVAAFRQEAGHVTDVELTDGRVLPADLVVVGIGATPATQWLEGSGLPLANGVVCDANLKVVGTDNVYAAGDVARWPVGESGVLTRIEHWTNANEHAEIVAAAITGTERPRDQVPYVWSDQYDRRIQIAGRPVDGQLARMTGAVDGEHLTAVYVDTEGRVVGAVVVDEPRTFMKLRKMIANKAKFIDSEFAPEVARNP